MNHFWDTSKSHYAKSGIFFFLNKNPCITNREKKNTVKYLSKKINYVYLPKYLHDYENDISVNIIHQEMWTTFYTYT